MYLPPLHACTYMYILSFLSIPYINPHSLLRTSLFLSFLSLPPPLSFSLTLSLTSYLPTSLSPVPSAPMNLSMLSQSETSVTFGWNPGSPTCNMNYSVSIQNCGTCNQTSYVSRTNVTCTNLELGQQMQCNVTVQSITECGDFSAPLTDVFKGTCIFHVHVDVIHNYLGI